MIDDNELNALIEDATKLGYDNKELLTNRLFRKSGLRPVKLVTDGTGEDINGAM